MSMTSTGNDVKVGARHSNETYGAGSTGGFGTQVLHALADDGAKALTAPDLVQQLEDGRAEVENQYVRSVRRSGNEPAQELVAKVFQLVDRAWRGIGEIPSSGLGLRLEFEAYDAEKKFELSGIRTAEPSDCMAGTMRSSL